MVYETVLASKSDGVAAITLNRPEVLNAMSYQLVTELDRAVTEAEEDDDIRAIVLTGAGERAFSAGGDIHEQRRDARELSPEEEDGRRAERARCMWHLAACTKPTLGAINGLAYGGGAALASCLDIRIGCEGTSFRFLAASYGRINSTWNLPLQVGWPIAKELLFTARVVEAEEAYRIGLLNHLVPRAQLMEKTMKLASAIAKNHPDPVRGVKRLLMDGVGSGWQEMWQREWDYLHTEMRVPGVEQAFKEFLERKGH